MAGRLLLASILLLGCMSAAQVRGHDPLTPAEIDQLRDTAMEPNERIKLFTRFARARLAAVLEVRNDPKASDRAQTIHDRLQEFADIYDELNDNIDNFIDRKEDMRKPLKLVLQADSEFETKLLAIKNAPEARSKEGDPYRFLVDSCLETVSNSTDDHKQDLDQQEEAAKHRKKS